MPTFRKYAFPKQADADKVLALCTGTTAVVDLGIIDSLICYDILWEADAPAIATQYETWPTPCGVHSFLGWDEQYAADYEQHKSL
ncbi:MAG: hypothetical protein EB117_17870 [Betaproteobacteria bacterium]|nr:hypothetical protein [Betaproteobacteria bacterium]